MILRKLLPSDADRMLEWMSDPDINRFFRWSEEAVSLNNAVSFIKSAQIFGHDRHYCVDEGTGLYMGTISLKSIDSHNLNAEYAISLHPDAIGKGYASIATTEILKIGFSELGLRKIYLNVRSDNARAIKFYEKYGFIFEGEQKAQLIKNGREYNLKWYRLLNEEFVSLKK
ncbi:MAG: N-acetyltransferase [Clostridia bacterium]|nr:N-acetyltransferase [Clostridia bacterium]